MVLVDSYTALAIFVSSWCVSCGYCCVLCSDYFGTSLYVLPAYGSALFYYSLYMLGIAYIVII